MIYAAGVCTALTHYTGNAMWDAAGSIAVGGLLGIIAMFLVQVRMCEPVHGGSCLLRCVQLTK